MAKLEELEQDRESKIVPLQENDPLFSWEGFNRSDIWVVTYECSHSCQFDLFVPNINMGKTIAVYCINHKETTAWAIKSRPIR